MFLCYIRLQKVSNELSKMCVLNCYLALLPLLFSYPLVRRELKLSGVDLWLLHFQQGLHRTRAYRDLAEAEGGAKGIVQEQGAAPS
jgi:hypothetical protein